MHVRPIFNPPIIGYSVEYYLQTPNGNQFIAAKVVDEPDRDILGYYGTEYHTATKDIIFNDGKKIITKGSDYYTRLVQLNGRDTNFYNTIIKVFGDVSAE